MGNRERTGGPAIETLRLTRIESRVVLDHRIDLLDEIDDKALRTVHTSIIVLALLVTTAGIVGTTRIRSLHWISLSLIGLAGVLFVFAIVVGTAIYSVSQIPFGVGPTHRSEALNGEYAEHEWLALLLAEYDGWTSEIRALTENNARWFTLVQGSFVAGVLSVALAIVLSPFPIEVGAALILASLAGALMVLRQRHVGNHR